MTDYGHFSPGETQVIREGSLGPWLKMNFLAIERPMEIVSLSPKRMGQQSNQYVALLPQRAYLLWTHLVGRRLLAVSLLASFSMTMYSVRGQVKQYYVEA